MKLLLKLEIRVYFLTEIRYIFVKIPLYFYDFILALRITYKIYIFQLNLEKSVLFFCVRLMQHNLLCAYNDTNNLVIKI